MPSSRWLPLLLAHRCQHQSKELASGSLSCLRTGLLEPSLVAYLSLLSILQLGCNSSLGIYNLADIVVGSCNERALNCTLPTMTCSSPHTHQTHTGTYNTLSQYSHAPLERFVPLPLGPLPSESPFRFLLCLPLLFAGFVAATCLRLAAATLSRRACLAFDLPCLALATSERQVRERVTCCVHG